MLRKFLLLFFGFLAFLNAVPSCYEIYKITKQSQIDTAVFVLIDETTPFNKTLKEQILSNVLAFTQSSNHIFIGKFSSLIGEKYNETLFETTLDAHLSEDERFEINKSLLLKIDKCLKDQIGFVRESVKNSINSAFSKDNIAKSDIFFALQDFAKSSIEPLNAKRKIVILASDMLENSALTSFYAKNSPRQIEVKKELFADFGEAEIFVIGAGLNANSKSYVNTKILANLKAFWQEYFAKSNAVLKEFGTPALKTSIK